MFYREYTSALLILVKFMEKGHEIYHFWAIPQFNTGTQIGVVPVPIGTTKVVLVPRQSVIGTHLQKRVGTGTNQSGTGTDASRNPDSRILALLSPNSSNDSIGTLIND